MFNGALTEQDLWLCHWSISGAEPASVGGGGTNFFLFYTNVIRLGTYRYLDKFIFTQNNVKISF